MVLFGFLAIVNLAFYLALWVYYAGFLPIKQDFIIRIVLGVDLSQTPNDHTT
ncbi:hypothetical protein AO382_0604 [Moraxella catarrhalis]|uniref:Uncharacterized protein n=1 Tax=Moraxella catarrhalis TaxID=480 RepID=A0A7Z0UZJ8_MORCA|nr:hypothetical protein AO382_0604 [Moraxella catarrhalis]